MQIASEFPASYNNMKQSRLWYFPISSRIGKTNWCTYPVGHLALRNRLRAWCARANGFLERNKVLVRMLVNKSLLQNIEIDLIMAHLRLHSITKMGRNRKILRTIFVFVEIGRWQGVFGWAWYVWYLSVSAGIFKAFEWVVLDCTNCASMWVGFNHFCLNIRFLLVTCRFQQLWCLLWGFRDARTIITL